MPFERRQGHHRLSRLRRRRGVGRRRRSIPRRGAALRQRQRYGLDRRAGAERRRGRAAGRSICRQCAVLPPRRSRRRAAADPVARRHRRAPVATASSPTIIRQGAGRMPGFPYFAAREPSTALVEFLTLARTARARRASPAAHASARPYRFTGYKKFLDPDGYPAVAPPWGTLNAIDLNTGEYAWTIPLGEYPELAAQGMKNTGTRELRRAGRHRRRAGLHRRDELRSQDSARSTRRPARCCGRRRCRFRATRRRRPTRSTADSSS